LDSEFSSNILIRCLRFIVVATPCYFMDLYINLHCVVLFFELSLLSWVVAYMFKWSLKQKKTLLGFHSVGKPNFRNQMTIVKDFNVNRKYYLKLYLFSSILNQTYSCLLSWRTFMLGMVLVLCNYACIKIIGEVHLLFIMVFFGVSVCAFCIIVIICPLLESLYENSVLFLRNVSSAVDNHNVLKRQVASCRPCRIVNCSLFFAKRSTKCSYFDNCCQFTVNCLLMF